MPTESRSPSRSYSYERPITVTPEVAGLTGLETIQRLVRGELPAPSITATLDFRLVEVEKGRAVFEGDPGDFVLNPMGTVHGGYTATILDSALGCAVHTMMPAGVSYTTVELKVNYVRAMRPGDGAIRAEATIIHAGGTLLTAEARMTRIADGKLIAHATTTCMALR